MRYILKSIDYKEREMPFMLYEKDYRMFTYIIKVPERLENITMESISFRICVINFRECESACEWRY